MKRQGIEGFTFDSEAEEWAAWAQGCLEHNRPKTKQAREHLKSMMMAYCTDAFGYQRNVYPGAGGQSANNYAEAGFCAPLTPAMIEYAQFARHSAAQPQNTVGIGEGSGRGDKAPVWPFLLLALLVHIAVFSLGKAEGWW